MPLRKRQKTSDHEHVPKVVVGEEKRSKRQRIVDFFRPKKQKNIEAKHEHPPNDTNRNNASKKPPRDSKIADSTKPAKSSSSIDVQKAVVDEAALPTPPPEPAEQEKVEPKIETLSEEHIRTLFSGAPHFSLERAGDRTIPSAAYPWDFELTIRDVSDSVRLPHPAFSAVTLHRHLPALQQAEDQEKAYKGYNLDVIEMPSMLSAQGIEPGTVGFTYFLESPKSDNLVTEVQQAQTSNEYIEALRNKELMQNNPERLGIRRVDQNMIHDRLVEFGDLMEAFQDGPERLTILNNQSSGDLYANLFGKFLTPPRYDGTTNDPTGIKVQIDTLLKVLQLKGVWYDFSLVEWRIRLGQVLWNGAEPEPEDEHDEPGLWTDQDILLLQITLACELLLRLDAITSLDPDDVKSQMHVSPQDLERFSQLKTRKTDWDLVLARRYLENILIMKNDTAPEPKSRGLLSLLAPNTPKEILKSDIILLPQHQARQLSGLLYFAQTLQWPGIDLLLAELASKICATDSIQEAQTPTLPGKYLDPSTPSLISVYGTPLTTPRPGDMIDSYFGQFQRSISSQSSSRTLQVPLTTTLLSHADDTDITMNVGGWLSRSYLTGLILPGEAISHFLMSTLLENDKLAIAALGDAANLYGGFIYANRSWWSKVSIVSRVLGCIDGAVECMGWVTFSKLPEEQADGWYAVSSTPVQLGQPPRITADEDLVAQRSAIIPGDEVSSVQAEHLILPRDAATPPIPFVEFTKWNLTPVESEQLNTDSTCDSKLASESYVSTITFSAPARGTLHDFRLTYDVYFLTSWPCTPPAASPMPSLPQILKRSQTMSISRTSSRRSIHSTRTTSNRSSRLLRRNSHGFEPLLSHPPDSPMTGPTRMYSPVPDGGPGASSVQSLEPMNAHPLHLSYKHKTVLATDVLDPNFTVPFTMHEYSSLAPSASNTPAEEGEEPTSQDDADTVLILDARSSKDLELLARAWCAERGFHAIVGRVSRTCLACCVREARGLGVNVVIRV